MTRNEIIHEDFRQIVDAIGKVLAENNVSNPKITMLLSNIVQAGVLADRQRPLEMFDAYYYGTEAVQNAIFRINALVSHVKD